jgi:hypothetical protein
VPVAVRLVNLISSERPVNVPELGPCWPFAGARTPKGYGRIRDDAGRLAYPHRVSLALALGRPLRPGMFSNHRCGFKACVRPAHLYEGTQSENEFDKHAYFTVRPPKGDAIGSLQLLPEAGS